MALTSTYDTLTDKVVVTGSARSPRRHWSYRLELYQADGELLTIEGTLLNKVDVHEACQTAVALVNREIADGLPEPARIKVTVMSKKKTTRAS